MAAPVPAPVAAPLAVVPPPTPTADAPLPRVPPALFTCAQLEAVQSQVGSAGRVRYSCVDASPRLLLLGANTGSIYIFTRPNIEFQRLWSNTDILDSLSCIKINPSEKLFAVSTVRGQVYIIQLAKPGEKEQVLLKISDHKDAEITALAWQDNVGILSGDDTGAVFYSSLANAGMFFQADLLYRADSRVVQLDVMAPRVLVSSLTKSTVIDVPKRTSVPVGTRPRDGRFGGCFLGGSEQLLAARPGKRLWLAESSTGKVLNTLTFTTSAATQAANFTRLLPFGPTRVATWDEGALFVINVVDVQVSAEYTQLGIVTGAAACDNDLYLVGGGGRTVLRVQALAPRDFVALKCNTQDWRAALEAAITHRVLVLSLLRMLQQRLGAADANAPESASLAALIGEAEAAEQEQLRREKELAQKRQEEEEARKKRAEEERIARERELERKKEEKRKADEEARRIEEERKKAEEERRKVEEEKRRVEDERRKIEDEKRRKIEEERRKVEEEKRKVEEEKRRAEEERIRRENPETTALVSSIVAPTPLPVQQAVHAVVQSVLSTSTPLPDTTPIEAEPMPASQAEALAVKRTRRLKRTIDVMPLSSGPNVPTPPPTGGPPALSHSQSQPILVDRSRSPQASPLPMRPEPTLTSNTSPSAIKSAEPQPPRSVLKTSDTAVPQQQFAPQSVTTSAPPSLTASGNSPFVQPGPLPLPLTNPSLVSQPPPPPPHAERSYSLGALTNSASQLLSGTKSLVAPLDRFIDGISTAAPIKAAPASPMTTPLSSLPPPTSISSPLVSAQKSPVSGAQATQPPQVIAPPAASASLDGKPHLLTQTVHEAITLWKSTARVGQLPALLMHWLSTYDPAAPPRVSSSWLTEILSANFEICSRGVWTEDAALEFLAKHEALLDCSLVFAAANRTKWSRCAKVAMETAAKQTLDPMTNALRVTLQRHLHETVDARAALELLRTQANWVWIAESLPRLHELDAKSAISLAVSSYPSLQPWKVTELFGTNEAAVRDYITGLMANEDVRANEELVSQWLAVLLRDAPPADHLFISIGMPKRGALNVVWQQQVSLDELLTKPGYSYPIDEALTACKNAGYFRGVLQLAARSSNTELELEVSLQVDDVSAFNNAAQRTSSEARWQRVLLQATELRAVDQRRGDGEARQVSKELIVSAVLAAMGPEAAAELLLRDESFVDDVQPQVFPSFVSAFERQAEERAVVHRLLESLDAFMWTPKTLTLAPQLKNLRDSEIAGTRTSYVTEIEGKPVVAFDESPLPEFMEQRHHWGVEFSVTGCTLPLREEVGPNIVVFHCGHAFHQPCITEEACRVCFYARSTSLLRPGQFPIP